jgi:hypothetical protein
MRNGRWSSAYPYSVDLDDSYRFGCCKTTWISFFRFSWTLPFSLKRLIVQTLQTDASYATIKKKKSGNKYSKDNVTFYLPRPLHFLSYQLNRLLTI